MGESSQRATGETTLLPSVGDRFNSCRSIFVSILFPGRWEYPSRMNRIPVTVY